MRLTTLEGYFHSHLFLLSRTYLFSLFHLGRKRGNKRFVFLLYSSSFYSFIKSYLHNILLHSVCMFRTKYEPADYLYSHHLLFKNVVRFGDKLVVINQEKIAKRLE